MKRIRSSPAVWVAAALLVAAGAGAALVTVLHRPSPPTLDEPALPSDSIGLFARIQTGMNRAAAGVSVRPGGAAVDPLENLADALQALLAGNFTRAGRLLDEVEQAVAARVPSDAQIAADPSRAERAEWLAGYFHLLPGPPGAGGGGGRLKAEVAALLRFATVMRKVDAVLLADMLPKLEGWDLVARRGPVLSPFDGVWLRLPCRVAAERRPAIEAAAKRLKQLAGPLTDCRRPAEAHQAARPPLETPLMAAARGGTLAEIGKALAAGADIHRADARGWTALHHLQENGSLSAADRAQAEKLLH